MCANVPLFPMCEVGYFIFQTQTQQIMSIPVISHLIFITFTEVEQLRVNCLNAGIFFLF